MNLDPSKLSKYSQPQLLDNSQELIKKLKTFNSDQLQDLMGVSKKIADLNVDRNNSFSVPFNINNSKQAILAFKGDVYQGMSPEDFDSSDYDFAHQHIGILSGLYGFLRPLDLMQPYRLEMGTRLKVNKHNNLYDFWGNIITKKINESPNKFVVNLASNEYFKSIKQQELKAELWTVNFKELRNGKYKVISFNAKRARGMMCRYVVKNRLVEPLQMKAFNMDNYIFNEELSKEKELIFTR
ncbi:MAG: peroxide stress protein YaaA [Saprospiraceae bacterium]|nr:peroxide stress protein YaaA [Saprospiraceae bacterium]